MAQHCNACPLCDGTVRAGVCEGECPNTPESTLLSAALIQVESASIRAWATSERNRPVWLHYARGAIQSAAVTQRAPSVDLLTAFIVATAIGL